MKIVSYLCVCVSSTNAAECLNTISLTQFQRYPFFKVLAATNCDTDTESKELPSKEWALLPTTSTSIVIKLVAISTLKVWRQYRTTTITDLYTSLWSSGQSFWLQIQRSWVRFPALPDFLRSSGSGTGSTQNREDNWEATWRKSSGSGLENRD
jgi:hypothetical protein